MEEEKLLRRKQVRQLLGLHETTLTRWKKTGVLVPVTIGGLDFYRESDMRELMANGSREDNEVEHFVDPDTGTRI